MNVLDWLVGYRFESLTKRDFDWFFQFDDNVAIVAGSLWRLLVNGTIRITDDDHGHAYGLPSPINCEAIVNERLSGAVVRKVDLCQGTLDLRIQFDSAVVVELLPNSSGYEAWEVSRVGERFIAVGGGRLDVVDDCQAAND
jgi:hypothetical protein